jgi:ATP-dependent Lhr-like helicase
MLDELTSAGEVLWTGSSPLPGGDGWVALAPAEVGFLLPRADEEPGSPVAQEVLGLLRQGGGWFVPDLRQRMADPHVVADAIAQGILDLLWCGLISNDSIEPIRAMLDRSPGRRRRVAPGARHLTRRPARGRYADLWHRPQLGGDASGADSWAAEPGTADAARGGSGRAGSSPARSGRSPELPGRWFALPSALPSREVVALSRAEAHLDRLGIVTRGAVLASGDPGGFAAAYRTLSLMEERGRVQRVYAVEGLGASQFALTGVVDQVRAVERELADGQAEHLLLATTDPANPYGAALEWPTSDWAGGPGSPHRPSRGAGCHVVLVSGKPILYVERGGHTLLTFTVSAEEGDTHRDLAVAARLLHAAVKAGTVCGLTISRVNGTAVMEPGGPGHVKRALEDAGFGLTPRGYRVPR